MVIFKSSGSQNWDKWGEVARLLQYCQNKEEWSHESCWSTVQVLLEVLSSSPLEGFKQETDQPPGVVSTRFLLWDGKAERMTSQVPLSTFVIPISSLHGKGSANHLKPFGSNNIQRRLVLPGSLSNLVLEVISSQELQVTWCTKPNWLSPSPWLATEANLQAECQSHLTPKGLSSPIFPQIHIPLLSLSKLLQEIPPSKTYNKKIQEDNSRVEQHWGELGDGNSPASLMLENLL